LALYKNKRIDIILPWRIGDAILNIPMLVCLKQLNQKHNDNNKIRIIAKSFLQKLYAPYQLSGGLIKFISQNEKSAKKMADFLFFLVTTDIFIVSTDNKFV